MLTVFIVNYPGRYRTRRMPFGDISQESEYSIAQWNVSPPSIFKPNNVISFTIYCLSRVTFCSKRDSPQIIGLV